MTASDLSTLRAMQTEFDFLSIFKLQGSKLLPGFADAFVALDEQDRHKQCQSWKEVVERALKEISKTTTDDNPINGGSNTVFGTAAALIDLIGRPDFSFEHELLPIVTLLHDSLVQLPSDVDKLKNCICQTCERWWLKDLDSGHMASKNAVLYLLERTTLQKKVNKADIKRLYSMRNCLVASFVDQEIQPLLKKCSTSSSFLHDSDGQKFIASLFNIDVELVDALHFEMKIKLVDSSKLESTSCGEIYLRAWTSANDVIRKRLEECIQDIIEHAIGASTPKLFASLCRFLVAINSRKNDRRLGDLSVRLYAPILWRSLKAANGTVRMNATSIFFEIFPLEDPSIKSVEANEDLQRQINVVEDLLFDPYPVVRARAARGTCEILTVYWEIFQPASIKSLLLSLIKKLAFDATSVQVRISVFKGLSRLVDNPMSHPFLVGVLPKIGCCIHDVAECVRIVFVEFLLKLVNLKQIKFWDVVSMDELLSRLAIDTLAVGRRITRLIRKSFHPTTKGNEVLIERVVHLVSTNPEASRCFYLHAHHVLSTSKLVNYMLLVGEFLYKYVMSEFQKAVARGHMDSMYEDVNDVDDDDDETEGCGGGQLSLNDDLSLSTEVIAAILDTVSILWATLRPTFATEDGKPLHKRLLKRYVRAVPKIHKFLKDSDAAASILYLSSFLPPSQVSMSVSYCTSQLRMLQPDSPLESYDNLLECMCNWRRLDDVLDIVTEWLDAGFSNDFVTPVPTRMRPSSRRVRFVVPREPRPQLAIDMLTFMLRQPSCRRALLTDMRTPLVQMTQRLRKIQASIFNSTFSLKVLNEQLANNVDMAASDVSEAEKFSVAALELMYKLCVLLHDNNDDDGDEAGNLPFDGVHVLFVTLNWVETQVLPQLDVTDETNSSTNSAVRLRSAEKRRRGSINQQLALDVVRCSLDICSNMLQVGVVDMRLVSQIANLVGGLLAILGGGRCQFGREEYARAIICDACGCIGHLLEYGLVSGADGHIVRQTTVPSLIGAFFQGVRVLFKRFPDAKLTFAPTVKPAMTEILNSYLKYTSPTCPILRGVLATMIAVILGELSEIYNYEDGDEENEDFNKPPQTVECLPALSYLIMSVVISRATILRLFLQETVACLRSGAISNICGLLAGCCILHILQRHVHNIKESVPNFKESVFVLEDLIVGVRRSDEPAVNEKLTSKVNRANDWLTSLKKCCNIS